MDNEPSVNIPQWIINLTALVRPGGVALMFLLITVFPIIFALFEIGIEGVGNRMAGTIAGYFQAIPEIFYDTLQIMFMAYVLGKSGEKIAEQVVKKKTTPKKTTEE